MAKAAKGPQIHMGDGLVVLALKIMELEYRIWKKSGVVKQNSLKLADLRSVQLLEQHSDLKVGMPARFSYHFWKWAAPYPQLSSAFRTSQRAWTPRGWLPIWFHLKQTSAPRGADYHFLRGLVPSGKHTKNYGKSPFLMGKLTINDHFQ